MFEPPYGDPEFEKWLEARNEDIDSETRYRLDELETDYRHALLYSDNDRNRVNAAIYLLALADVRRVLDV